MPSKTKLIEAALTALLGVVGTIGIAVLTGAWSSKEDTVAHQADIAAVVQMTQRTLDVVCDQALTKTVRTARACSAPAPVVQAGRPK